jgi:hypothetical protein
MIKVTRAPAEKMFGGERYSIERGYSRIPSYPSTKSVAERVAKSFRASGYSVRLASFNLVTVGGKYPTRKTVWYIFTR